MSATGNRAILLAAFAVGTLALTSCTDETIVYRERPIFEEPIQAAMGFLGYSEPEEKLTVCGNCHVGTQNAWEETAHAFAWEGLQAGGHAQPFCEGCHTVNSLGDDEIEGDVPFEPAGGYLADESERYHDVQCENCHGPGIGHVRNPDAGAPLAPVAVDVVLGADGAIVEAAGCGECHTGTHHPFVEEWAVSAHGNSDPDRAHGAPGRSGCEACHSGEGALQAWGVQAEYENKAEFLGSETENMPITCAVCHDPHSTEYGSMLRYPVETANIEDHLCAQCHDRRTSPDPTSSHGLEPHSPESALLVGEAGFFFPDMPVEQGEVYGTHGPGGNPRLCATCHVQHFEVTDEATGEFVMTATGHKFNAIPCVDAQGVPQPGTVNCPVTADARSFTGCTGSGCHGTENAAATALRTAAQRLQSLADELHELLVQVDPNLMDAGGAIDATDGVLTTAEGAFFNMELAVFGGDIEGGDLPVYDTWGTAAHNPFAMEQLLITSIERVEQQYGVSASPALARSLQISQHP